MHFQEKITLKEYQTILYDLYPSGTVVITLNRPDKLNAVDDTLSYELMDALNHAEEDDKIRCILLTGAGKGFCAGQDLQSRAVQQSDDAAPPALGESIRKRYMPIILKLRTIEKPIVCAINGVAAGAGASIAFACDYRIAANHSSFIQAFIKIGLIPDSGACFMLPRLIGLGRAMDLMMTGRKVDAQEALDMGLVNQVCPVQLLLERALIICEEFSKGPTRGYGLLKQAVNRAMELDLESYLDLEANLQDTAGRTEDFKEGVAAFMEKRSPVFTGQ